MGWGRDELINYYYWGGTFDLQEYLIEQGYDVHTLSVGPVSSNWDRAIEAYYQIKGGTLDYGILHSTKYSLIQKPESKIYEGIYKEWDKEHPIHIIGHSQGGQTARMLEHILKNNYEEEDSDLLINQFDGWIKSITTISTPHNGTTLTPIINNMFPYIESMVIWFDIISPDALYSFDLDQWGFNKRNDENLYHYVKRLRKSPISTTKNFCSWDLSLEGSKFFNKEYKTDSTVYYFTYSTTNNNNPRLIYRVQSNLIKNSDKYSEEWRENDGIVNTVSMLGPENSKIQDYNGIPITGVWQNIKKINLDHNEIIGHHNNREKLKIVKHIYLNQCKLLYNLD